jgi:DNA repair ATPase RecN
MWEVMQPYIGEALAAIVGGFVVWYPNRLKTRAEGQQAILDMYQESLTDLKQRYDEKYEDLKTRYDEKYNELKETFDLRLKNVTSELENVKLLLEDWKRKYFALKKEFDQYKKDHP